MMSEEKIPPHIHPFNFFIVQRLDEIWRDISRGYPNDAIKKLYFFTQFFEDQIKDKLKDYLVEAKKFIVNESLKGDSFAEHFLDALMSCLHEQGYFTMAKQRLVTADLFKRLESEDAVE
ncbi:MAG: hypothetical protein QXL54_03160 [Candidatus Bathyarchaeia archaeon]